MENMKMEMTRLELDNVGVSEIRRTGADDFWSDDYSIIYSSDSHRDAGVGFIVKKEWGRRVKAYCRSNERIMLIKMEGEPADTVIEQRYMPTSNHTEEEIEEIHEQLDEASPREGKRDSDG
jgi:DNA-binding IclR family transcriptional regulator